MVFQFFRTSGGARALRRAVAAAVLGLAGSATHVFAQETVDTPLSLKRNLALDGNFNETGHPRGVALLTAPTKFGPWTVDMGSVGLHVGDFDTPDGNGNVIDLNGSRSGSVYQPISTVPGQKYTVRFLVSGNWTTNPDRPRAFSVRFGSERVSWTLNRPVGWSKTNMQWQVRSAEFTATSVSSGLRFTSDSSGMPDGAVICRVEVRAEAGMPGPLDSIPVPLPPNLADYVLDHEKAIALGKALFWDMQVGSDGKTACASCHWHAGADIRTQNTLHPGAPGSAFGHQSAESRKLHAEALVDFRGPNQVVKPEDYPFHRLKNPLQPGNYPGDSTPDNPVLADTLEVTGSQGVISKSFLGIVEGSPVDVGVVRVDPVFQVHGANVRQVTGRNAPTTINAVFFDRSFWDGRANRYFNGVNEFGDLDPNARVLKATASGDLEPVRILLDNAALASQAVGPVNSSVEMSWLARSFPEVGRKMFALRPLGLQKIAADDSVLGVYRHSSGRGLDPVHASYAALIRAAFRPEWWSSNKITADGYTQMEANFSLYWGLALMMYQSTLVSDQAPIDQFARGDEQALSPQAKEGMKIFLGAGKCINCHGGPEFAGATVSKLRGALGNGGLIEFMPMEKGTAYYDAGFYNIGVRPTHEDLGLGASHHVYGPLSYSRQEQDGRNPDPAKSINPNARVTVNGAFKTPTLRNIELTGPYMHNGGMKSLEEVVQFYTRGADFFHANVDDLDPDVNGIPELQGNPAGVTALVEFMRHLTDPRVRYQAAPFDHPELLLPDGHGLPAASVALDRFLRLQETGASGGAPLESFEYALTHGLSPIANPPASEEPVVDEPVIDEPVADEPVIDEPMVDEPVVDEPVVDEPVIDEPVIDEPVIDEPVIDEPMVDEPVIDEPVIDEPVVDEPVIDEPVIDEPVIDEPMVDEPVIDEPVFDEPMVDEPVIDEPVVDEPVVDEPVVDEPVIDEPVIDEPVIDDPVVDEPVIDEPVVDEPVIDEPVIDEPVVDEPVVDEPVIDEAPEDEAPEEEPAHEEHADIDTDHEDATRDESVGVKPGVKDDIKDKDSADEEAGDEDAVPDESAVENPAKDGGDQADEGADDEAVAEDVTHDGSAAEEPARKGNSAESQKGRNRFEPEKSLDRGKARGRDAVTNPGDSVRTGGKGTTGSKQEQVTVSRSESFRGVVKATADRGARSEVLERRSSLQEKTPQKGGGRDR
ncbi:MAG: hypothetical protein RLZZ436_3213 [Planctomycetota bacterium]